MNVVPQFTLEPQPDLLAPIDRAGSQITDHLDLLEIAGVFVDNEIIALANALGNSDLHAAGDRLRSLLNIAHRDLETIAVQLDDAHEELHAQRYAAQSTVGRHLEARGWLQTHPRLAAAIRKWTSTLEAYQSAAGRLADLSPEDPAYDVQIDALTEEASRALGLLIATASPGLRALRQKLAILAREGAMGNEDVPQMLLEDVDQLLTATEYKPWLVQSDAPPEPCACPTDTHDAADAVIVAEA